uniref:Uncharacterized protein n=1 Tax=Rhizophora mucronata TaxID=61149 RepID=A0A2P2JBH8_RHIMU
MFTRIHTNETVTCIIKFVDKSGSIMMIDVCPTPTLNERKKFPKVFKMMCTLD